MMRHSRRTRLAILALVAGMALIGARPALVAAKGPSEEELLGRIEKGGTSADHTALATYYHEQAKAAQKKGADHEAMASKYGAVMSKTDWPTHCRSLASYYRKLAEEYDAMAMMHESQAAERRKK